MASLNHDLIGIALSGKKKGNNQLSIFCYISNLFRLLIAHPKLELDFPYSYKNEIDTRVIQYFTAY